MHKKLLTRALGEHRPPSRSVIRSNLNNPGFFLYPDGDPDYTNTNTTGSNFLEKYHMISLGPA